MARTTSVAVCKVVDTSLGDDVIAAFINTANVMVTEYLDGKDLSAALLTEIETYLAAHFVTLRDRRVSKEQADGVSFTYESMIGEGLDSSVYGQTAQALDPTGALAALGDDDRIEWFHRAGSERTNLDYPDLLPSLSSLRTR
jgi:hypothetical protein